MANKKDKKWYSRNKLDTQAIETIAEGRLAGLKWKEIAAMLNIHIQTLANWRERADNDTEGIYKDLADALHKVEAKLVKDAFTTIKTAATETRITKTVTKNYVDKDGNEVTEVTEFEEGPSTRDAWKLLERKRNEFWGNKDGSKKLGDQSGSQNSTTSVDELDNAFDRAETETETSE